MAKQGCSKRGRSEAGFSLIEMVVVTFFVLVALVGVMGGISALAAADARAQRIDVLQRLALQKLNELNTVADPGTADVQGDFSDQGYPTITWHMDVTASGITNLDSVTLTTTQDNVSQKLTLLVYVPPTTTGATTATGGATP